MKGDRSLTGDTREVFQVVEGWGWKKRVRLDE